jgi:hypothetical protein
MRKTYPDDYSLPGIRPGTRYIYSMAEYSLQIYECNQALYNINILNYVFLITNTEFLLL